MGNERSKFIWGQRLNEIQKIWNESEQINPGATKNNFYRLNSSKYFLYQAITIIRQNQTSGSYF